MTQDIPSIPTESLSIPNADLLTVQHHINSLHYRLMAVYVYVIEAVSRPDRLPKGDEPSKRKAWLRLKRVPSTNYQKEFLLRGLRLYKRRPVTRNLVYSHVKGKLRELRAAYVQIEQVTSDSEAASDFRTWLRETQDSISRFSDTLSVMGMVRRIIVALWPLIIALAVLAPVWSYLTEFFTKIFKGQTGFVTVELVFIAALAIMYITGVAGSAAAKKRRLFLATISLPFSSPESPISSISNDIAATNVYEVENALFNQIGKSKRLEFALDHYASAVFGLAAASAFGYLAISVVIFYARNPQYSDQSTVIFFGAMAIVGILVAILHLIRGLTRTVR